ncbi:MAG TPA: DUF3299 domain-containing protein [Candidatus Limnocylindria bacterium]|nr:DUF3299 domain-containing protein [Candidatus Limnocylindria bacterium]
MNPRAVALVLVAAIWLGAPGALAQERPEVIDWKHLVPAGYDPSDLVRKYQKEVSRLRDDDPRAEKAAERLRKAWENAPVVQSLSNKTVKLSGFLVTLEGDGKAVSEFLLVPYFGACIHVPPPPSNQVVLVRTGRRPFKVTEVFDMVSVTGRLRTERSSSELASASYVIEATHVETHKP